LAGGVFLGLIVGVLPGLGGTAGLSLLLPFVFGMEPSHALAMMIGLQSVTATSDTFPSVLMGIPGTASSQATVMDGFPMSKQGQATRALSAAFSASLFGGLFGALVLTFTIFVAEPLILAMGFGEQMMLVILALTMIGMLTGGNPLRGIGTCWLGLMVGALGSAPATGVERLSFGTVYLIEPVKLVIVGLAMFALPEIVDLLRRSRTISNTGKLGAGWLQGVKDACQNWWLVLRCAAIGTIVGALPGLGGSVVDWIAYSHAIQTTKDKHLYGTGDVRGVIAPESANNAKEGGALIPTLIFGIPGSGSMAILLGGFILIGIEPGVEMMTFNLHLVYLMVWSVALANVMGAGTCVILSSQIAKLTTIRYTLLAPFMFGLIFFAAFQATRDWGDLIALMILGTLGVYMKRFGWPRPALLIGFVLADKVEEGVYHTLTVYGSKFLERPVVIVLILLTLFSIYAAAKYKPNQPKMEHNGVHGPEGKMPQIIFLLFLITFAITLFVDSLNYQFLTSFYPQFVAVGGLVFMVPLGILAWKGTKPSTVFQDEERGDFGQDVEAQSAEHYLFWLLGMMGISALIGFVLGSAAFIYAFVRIKAKLSHFYSGVCALAFFIFLATLAKFLTLFYPEGLLQYLFASNGMELMWPLGQGM
jgi:putative tricarboxylic transport membrane protein